MTGRCAGRLANLEERVMSRQRPKLDDSSFITCEALTVYTTIASWVTFVLLMLP